MSSFEDKALAFRSVPTRIRQGDIYRDVEYVTQFRAVGEEYELTILRFPLVVVLTQDCDLEQTMRTDASNNDKCLISLLVAPLYNADHVAAGDHMKHLELKMAEQHYKKKNGLSDIGKNQKPRFHFLDLEPNFDLPPLIVDFKHYFSVPLEQLSKETFQNYVCSIDVPWRESLSQRFANYLSRIGLPVERLTSLA